MLIHTQLIKNNLKSLYTYKIKMGKILTELNIKKSSRLFVFFFEKCHKIFKIIHILKMLIFTTTTKQPFCKYLAFYSSYDKKTKIKNCEEIFYKMKNFFCTNNHFTTFDTSTFKMYTVKAPGIVCELMRKELKTAK